MECFSQGGWGRGGGTGYSVIPFKFGVSQLKSLCVLNTDIWSAVIQIVIDDEVISWLKNVKCWNEEIKKTRA